MIMPFIYDVRAYRRTFISHIINILVSYTYGRLYIPMSIQHKLIAVADAYTG